MSRDEIWQTATTYVPSFETCKSLWDHGIKLTKTIACYVKPARRETYELEYFFPDGIALRAYQGEDIGWHAYPAPFAQDIIGLLNDAPHIGLCIIKLTNSNVLYIKVTVTEYGSIFVIRPYAYECDGHNLAEQLAKIAIDLAKDGALRGMKPIENSLHN